jgi:ATP-dependent DNA ligase
MSVEGQNRQLPHRNGNGRFTGAALYLACRHVVASAYPCLPTNAPQPPSGELWLHEIKHDGFRVIARKNGHRVKLYRPSCNDLTPR